MKEYIYLFIPLSAVVLTQLYKFITESISAHKLMWSRLFDGYGGMPSSHTALVSSLAGTVLYINGITSPLFAISLIFALITSIDAVHIRGEMGKQAVLINKMNSKKILKEQIGHTINQVIVGAVFGLLYSYLLVSIIM